MTISQICNILKSELLNNGYEYGFVLDGKVYKPNTENGFDAKYYALASEVYCVQAPEITIKHKIGTCIDAVVLMRHLLEKYNIPNKIWLIFSEKKNKAHTVLTFVAEGKTVYLELTPQYSRDWYGSEIIFENEEALAEWFNREGFALTDVTDSVHIGVRPFFLLERLK